MRTQLAASRYLQGMHRHLHIPPRRLRKNTWSVDDCGVDRSGCEGIVELRSSERQRTN
jgi:hypothetical protein